MSDKGFSISLKVYPNRKRFGFIGFNPELRELKISLKSPPRKGKANQEILKEMEKFFATEVKILRGLKSNKKLLWINSKEEALEKLSQLI